MSSWSSFWWKKSKQPFAELFIKLCTKRFTNLLSSGAVKHPQHLLKVQCNLDSPSSFRGYVNFSWVSFLQFNSTSKKQWRKSGRHLSGATPEENRKEPTVWGAVELKIAPKNHPKQKGSFHTQGLITAIQVMTNPPWSRMLGIWQSPLVTEKTSPCWISGLYKNYRCLSLVVDDVVVVAVVVAHLPRTVDSPRHESHLATRSCFVHRQSGSSNRLKNAWAITDEAMKTAVIFGTVSAPILNHGFDTLEWELRDVFEKIVVEFVNTSCVATC